MDINSKSLAYNRRPEVQEALRLVRTHPKLTISGWANFKTRLMELLDIKEDFYHWNVPLEYIYAFKRVNGWTVAAAYCAVATGVEEIESMNHGK